MTSVSRRCAVPVAQWFTVIVLAIACMVSTPACGEETVRITDFSPLQIGLSIPDGWEFLDFPGIPEKTTYRIITDDRYDAVIHARSNGGAGGLVKPVLLRADEFSTLNWAWKVEKTIRSSAVGSRKGDDFPARIIVSFKTRVDKPSSIYDNALCYVWADAEPVGMIMKNPFHDHVMTVVAANSREHVGGWLELSRNLVDDYIAAFGRHPEWISAVTLMTDSDNSQTHAQAWYGPIELTGSGPDVQ